MTAVTSSPQEYPWWRLLVQGLLSLGAGILLIFRPAFSLDFAVFALGIYWLVLGLTTWFTLLTGRTHGRRLWYVLRGLLEVLAGVAALGFAQLATFGGANLVNTAIGVAGLVIGVIALLQAFQGGGWPSGLLGVLSVGFSLFVFTTRVFNIFDLTWLVGLIAIVAGIASVIAAFGMRTSGHSEHNPALGIWRIVALLVLLPLALVAIFVAWLSHVRWRGLRLHEWGVTYVCRLLLRLLRLRVACADPQQIAEMQGILFVNHLTFVDIPVLAALAPMRFLSTTEVYQVPVVGWVAKQIDTVFVNRRKRESRQASRGAIAESLERSLTPPFIIFPEGGFGAPTALRPFHYGSFAVAAENRFPYLPVGLAYDRTDILCWKGVKEERFVGVAWRILTFRGALTATLTPAASIVPSPDDKPEQLAHDAQRAVEAVLGLAPSPTVLESLAMPEGLPNHHGT